MPEWAEERRRRKWRWAGHVARRDDGRWTKKMLSFTPEGSRNVGRPRKRWEDDLVKFFTDKLECGGEWISWAQCRETWVRLEQDFVDFDQWSSCCGHGRSHSEPPLEARVHARGACIVSYPILYLYIPDPRFLIHGFLTNMRHGVDLRLTCPAKGQFCGKSKL